jgi:hypothetical protein
LAASVDASDARLVGRELKAVSRPLRFRATGWLMRAVVTVDVLTVRVQADIV